MTIGVDLEWTKDAIDVLGVSWDNGLRASATANTPESMGQLVNMMQRADHVVMQNGIDADCRQLAKAGIDVSWLLPKVRDTRLMMHCTHGHLAGSGSYDLRSI